LNEEVSAPEGEVKKRKIAMIGTAPSTRGAAPIDSDWEVWGQADYWAGLKRIDRWFEFAPFPKLNEQFQDYLAWLKEADFPIYMRHEAPELPTSREFPFKEMSERFGEEFMSATVVWMMCQAVTEHMNGHPVEVIGLWGYDLALDSEYSFQRPGVRHLQWVCRHHLPAMGFDPIGIHIPKGSDLLITPLPYPFAEDDPMVAKIRARKRDIQNKINAATNQANQLQANTDGIRGTIKYLEGAMEDLVYFERMATGHKEHAA